MGDCCSRLSVFLRSRSFTVCKMELEEVVRERIVREGFRLYIT